MIEKLVGKLEYKEDGRIDLIDGYDQSSVFLDKYRAKQFTSSDLIWNQRTRDEFRLILGKEIEDINSDKTYWRTNPYQDFLYTDHNKELKVDNVFIRLLNKDVYFSHKQPEEFLVKLVDKVLEVQDDLLSAFEVLMAIRNCIASPSIVHVSDGTKKHLISLIPLFIDFSRDIDSSKFSKMSLLILDAITNCIKKNSSLNDFLDAEGLCQHLCDILYQNENERVPVESILLCLQAVVNHKEVDVKSYLWDTGLLGLLIRHIYHTEEIRAQVMIVNFLLCNSDEEVVKYGKLLVKKYLPLDFSELFLSENISFIEDRESLVRQRGSTLRTNHYINLHGQEFEEKQEIQKTGNLRILHF